MRLLIELTKDCKSGFPPDFEEHAGVNEKKEECQDCYALCFPMNRAFTERSEDKPVLYRPGSAQVHRKSALCL